MRRDSKLGMIAIGALVLGLAAAPAWAEEPAHVVEAAPSITPPSAAPSPSERDTAAVASEPGRAVAAASRAEPHRHTSAPLIIGGAVLLALSTLPDFGGVALLGLAASGDADAQAAQTGAITLAIGLAATAGGVTMLVFGLRGSEDSPDAPPSATVELRATPFGLGLAGSF